MEINGAQLIYDAFKLEGSLIKDVICILVSPEIYDDYLATVGYTLEPKVYGRCDLVIDIIHTKSVYFNGCPVVKVTKIKSVKIITN